MKKNILIFILVILTLGFFSTSAILLAYISNSQFQNTLAINEKNQKILELEQELADALLDNTSNGVAVGEQNSNTPQTTVETKTRKTYTIEELDWLIKSESFSASTYTDTITTQIKNKNGLPYTGVNLSDSRGLNINIGLPYEASNYAYSDRVLIDKDSTIGDIYRVTSDDGIIFYTNHFYGGDGEMSCIATTGTEVCASPVLSNNKTEADSNFFQILCKNTSQAGLAACDALVASLEF